MHNSDIRKEKQNPQASHRAVGPLIHLSHHVSIQYLLSNRWRGSNCNCRSHAHMAGHILTNEIWCKKTHHDFSLILKNKIWTSVSQQDGRDQFPARLCGLHFYHFPSFTKLNVPALLSLPPGRQLIPLQGSPFWLENSTLALHRMGSSLLASLRLGLICSERAFVIREPNLATTLLPGNTPLLSCFLLSS